MLVVKRLYNFSYEQTERFVSDSIVLRQSSVDSTSNPLPMTPPSSAGRTRIGSETVSALNERAGGGARPFSLKVTRGRKLRVDSMVVETNIHHPTDSALLGDGVRVLSRFLRQAKKALCRPKLLAAWAMEAFRTRNRSVRRVAQRLHRRIARKKGEKAREELKEACRKLIAITQASCTQARELVEALREQGDGPGAGRLLTERFEHFLPLVEQGIAQASHRVLEGESTFRLPRSS